MADAQDLPFDDDSFDFVVSVYGVQFAPDQETAGTAVIENRYRLTVATCSWMPDPLSRS